LITNCKQIKKRKEGRSKIKQRETRKQISNWQDRTGSSYPMVKRGKDRRGRRQQLKTKRYNNNNNYKLL